MIDLYTWATPNGRKVSILLEELGLDYQVHAVDIGKGDQFKPEFLAISPNNRIPAIIDGDLALMESGAIMLYLATKAGRLLPKLSASEAAQSIVQPNSYWHVMEWLMWQMGGLGPMLGQTHHFLKYNQGKSPYAEERYLKETHRLYGVLDKRLEDKAYIVDEYSIADIAVWPWISRFEWQTIDLDAYPNVKRWYCDIATRPAVQMGYQVPMYINDVPMP
ncbi:MAG: glutathione S-transferase family protein [Pseudomonadales bacterium]|jgi:GST-like protein|tara:strand:- start:15149 stop:15805 length:657 start_codon:yes stop_codon:yes gene_type:complete